MEDTSEMIVTELEDGSAIVEEPALEEAAERSHYDNLVDEIPRVRADKIVTDLLWLIDADTDARKRRDEQYAEGIQRTGLGNEAPGGANFEGASRAVHPALAEGCVDFAARAIKELIPANGPVKTKITVGKADTKTLERARKKKEYLNWLFTVGIKGYRDEKEVLLTQLPLGGSQYEKYLVEKKGERYEYRMEFTPIDKMLLPFSASSFYTSPRATHVLDLTRDEFEARVADGFYNYDGPLSVEDFPEESSSEKATDKVEGLEQSFYNADGLRRIYEITCLYDLEDAKEEDENKSATTKPYVISIDVASGKLLSVYRNWEEDDEAEESLQWVVENKFIPWRGVYGIGLPHLIGSLAGSLTGSLRALLDSAHINNFPGALMLKGARASGQNVKIDQTQITEIDAPAGVTDIRQMVMPLPFNPPSTVLFQLLDWITNQAKGVVATAEERIAEASNNMPVGTALALIEQGSQVFSSIHARLHESERRSIEIVCRLVRQYPNMEDLAKYGLTPEDFDENDDVQPVSDPRIFSEAQRFAQLQEQLKLAKELPQLRWNLDTIARNGLELLGVDNIDNVLPPAPEEVSADPASENFAAAIRGATIKAVAEMDHVTHIRSHLSFVINPMFGAGPAVPFQALNMIMQDVNNHLLHLYNNLTRQMSQQHPGASPELGMAMGAELAMKMLMGIMPEFPQMMQQAQQVIQSKVPQPPVDPAVQKTFEAAMADIQRKAQHDQAMLGLEQQKIGADNQLKQQDQALSAQAEQMKAQLTTWSEQLASQTQLQVATIREEGQQLVEQLRQQVELMKNREDNRSHQQTELVKNHEDNMTQLRIALEKIKQERQAGNDELMVSQMQQISQALDSVGNGLTSAAMQDVLGALKGMLGGSVEIEIEGE